MSAFQWIGAVFAGLVVLYIAARLVALAWFNTRKQFNNDGRKF